MSVIEVLVKPLKNKPDLAIEPLFFSLVMMKQQALVRLCGVPTMILLSVLSTPGSLRSHHHQQNPQLHAMALSRADFSQDPHLLYHSGDPLRP